MKCSQILLISILSLLVAFSCSTESENRTTSSKYSEYQVKLREASTLGEKHNDFITWLYQNYWDSVHIFNTDSLLYKFLHRKAEVYFGQSIINLRSILLNGNSWVLISETSFDDYALITNELTSTEIEVLNTIFDEINNYNLANAGDVSDLLEYYDEAYEDLSESSYPHKVEMIVAVDVLIHSTNLWIDIYIDENGPSQWLSPCVAQMILSDGYAAASLCTDDCMTDSYGSYSFSDQVFCVASYSIAAYNLCN